MRISVRSMLPLCLLLIASSASATRISGTYVSRGTSFTLMLQLTETNNGQLSGLVSWLELQNDGDVQSGQRSVSGSADGDQITLKIGSGLESFLFGTAIAGTVSGN